MLYVCSHSFTQCFPEYSPMYVHWTTPGGDHQMSLLGDCPAMTGSGEEALSEEV